MEGSQTAIQQVQTALSSWGSTFQTDATSMITTMLPYALGVLGLSIAVMFGIKFFRKVANKA